MALYGIYGSHEVSACPINNKENAQYTNQMAKTDISPILPKYKINKIVGQYHSGFEHTFLWVFDAEDAQLLQQFALDTEMTNFNELKIVPLMEFKDTVANAQKKWNLN